MTPCDPPAVLVVAGPAGAGKTTVARALAERWACTCVEGDDLRIDSGATGVPIAELVEGVVVGAVAGEDPHVDVLWPLPHKVRMARGEGFNVDAAPMALVEGLGDRKVGRMVGTDVDIKALRDMPQRPMEHHVLDVLGVRDKRSLFHGRAFVGKRCW